MRGKMEIATSEKKFADYETQTDSDNFIVSPKK